MRVLKENWTFGIFLLAFLSLLFVGFSFMLDAKIDPVKKDIVRIEVDAKVRFDRISADTKARFDRMEDDIKAINEKLTQLLIKIK